MGAAGRRSRCRSIAVPRPAAGVGAKPWDPPSSIRPVTSPGSERPVPLSVVVLASWVSGSLSPSGSGRVSGRWNGLGLFPRAWDGWIRTSSEPSWVSQHPGRGWFLQDESKGSASSRPSRAAMTWRGLPTSEAQRALSGRLSRKWSGSTQGVPPPPGSVFGVRPLSSGGASGSWEPVDPPPGNRGASGTVFQGTSGSWIGRGAASGAYRLSWESDRQAGGDP
ncbi:MAG: hypothetical protein RLZ45_648, partial [Verrucomicrobiota bacterium]